MIEAVIELIHREDTAEDDLKTGVFTQVYPVGRDEFREAGVAGYKAENRFDVWASEYDGQDALEYKGRRLTIYRTYGPRSDGKIELYAAERVGNYGH